MEKRTKHSRRLLWMYGIGSAWLVMFPVFYFAANGRGNIGFILTIALLPLVLCLIYTIYVLNIKTGEIDKSNVVYDEMNKLATITRFNEFNGTCFGIKNYERHTTTYTPEQVIFTSATVGGVTTGGFSKVGGYKTNKSTSLLEHILTYNGDDVKNRYEKPEVWRILLSSEEMVIAAQKDPFISTMLDGNVIVLKTMSIGDCNRVKDFVSGFNIR